MFFLSWSCDLWLDKWPFSTYHRSYIWFLISINYMLRLLFVECGKWLITSLSDSLIPCPVSLYWLTGTFLLCIFNWLVQCFAGLCPDWEDWDPKKSKKNAKEAMDAAEKWLDIPQVRSHTLNYQDTDWLSVQTLWRNSFQTNTISWWCSVLFTLRFKTSMVP